MQSLDRIGNKVFGDIFVGRENLIKQLQDCCTSQNFSVVGLPKIGKSSLVYHSIVYNKRDVRRNNYRPFVPVFVDCGPASSIIEFFKIITSSVFNELKKVLPDDRLAQLIKDYIEYEDNVNNNLSISVMSFFKTLENYQIDIVIILDDFDRVRSIEGFDGTRHAIIRTLSELAYIKFIIISKRELSIIENWNEDPSHNPSNLYGCFKPINVGNFDYEEWNTYWSRVFSDHSDIIVEEDKERIKEIAFHYTGYNPYWTAVFARCYVDSLKYQLPFDDSKRQYEMTRCAYIPMKEFLCDDKNYKNNIIDTAIQSITGPVYKLNLVDVTTLEQYGFLTHINCDKKKHIFGNDWGCRFNDDNTSKSYIASSVHFTSFLIREFPQATYWQEWDCFFKEWHSLLSHLELPFDTSKTTIMQRWDSDFKPVFNNSFQWFSTRFDHIIGYKSKEKSELPINEECIFRVNKYLKELTNKIKEYLK